MQDDGCGFAVDGQSLALANAGLGLLTSLHYGVITGAGAMRTNQFGLKFAW